MKITGYLVDTESTVTSYSFKISFSHTYTDLLSLIPGLSALSLSGFGEE